MLTRAFDIFIGLIGCLCILLLLPAVALFIKMDSRGPVFYRCNRVGRGGRLFKMYKFRTMYETPVQLGASVSPQGDPRVTEVGRWLRRTKLNEFPQFINLLLGNMTLIGPRPEAPDLAEGYPPEGREIFSVKPGLIGPNQLTGRNEEEWFPPGVDEKQYYLEHILPGKIVNDLDYINHKTFLTDLKLIFGCVWVILSGAISRRHLVDNRSQLLMLVLDIICCLLSFTAAHYIRFEGLPTRLQNDIFLSLLPYTVVLRLPIFYYFGYYRLTFRHLNLADVGMIFDAACLSSGCLIIVSFFTGIDIEKYSRSIFIIDWICLTTMLITYRAVAKAIYIRSHTSSLEGVEKRRALICGADQEGIWCHRYLKENKDPIYEVMGFIDPDSARQHRHIDGLKVLGDLHHLEILSTLYKIQEVFVASDGDSPKFINRLQKTCDQLSLRLMRFVPRSIEEVSIEGKQ